MLDVDAKNGKILAADSFLYLGEKNTIRLYDMKGEEIKTIVELPERAEVVSYSISKGLILYHYDGKLYQVSF